MMCIEVVDKLRGMPRLGGLGAAVTIHAIILIHQLIFASNCLPNAKQFRRCDRKILRMPGQNVRGPNKMLVAGSFIWLELKTG